MHCLCSSTLQSVSALYLEVFINWWEVRGCDRICACKYVLFLFRDNCFFRAVQCASQILLKLRADGDGRVALLSGEYQCGIYLHVGIPWNGAGRADVQNFGSVEKMSDYGVSCVWDLPLIPGASVYYTVYNMVQGNLAEAADRGIGAVKVAFAIVLGIIFVVSIPKQWFKADYWRSRFRGASENSDL